MNQCVSHIKRFSDKQIEAGNKGTGNKEAGIKGTGNKEEGIKEAGNKGTVNKGNKK